MLTTETIFTVHAGNGGNGSISFYKTQRGPDGGNGGDGGDAYIIPTQDPYILANYTPKSTMKAGNGGHGMANKKTGASAANLEIPVPLGSVITDTHTKEQFELVHPDDRILLCKGGHGGRGNYEFRSSTRTTPEFAEKGEKGQYRHIHINYKLIADIGLIGFPNAGKSSLLGVLTAARPKIGGYPFTTLEPNLGERDQKIIADIPGLIEGAADGKGLGIKFLKHIERVSLLLHCISAESTSIVKDYKTIRNELEKFNKALLEKPEIIVLTKTDTTTPKEVKKMVTALKKLNTHVIPVSLFDDATIEKLADVLHE